MARVIKQESVVPGKVLRLENKMNVVVNKTRHIVFKKAREYCSGTMYTICSYIYLLREYGHEEAMEKLKVENTDTYLDGCLSRVSDIKQLVLDGKKEELEKKLFEILDTYNTRYLRQCKEFDLILIVASLDGYIFEEYENFS